MEESDIGHTEYQQKCPHNHLDYWDKKLLCENNDIIYPNHAQTLQGALHLHLEKANST